MLCAVKGDPISVAEAKTSMETMLKNANDEQRVPDLRCCLQGSFHKIGDELFQSNFQLESEIPKFLLYAQLHDTTGAVNAKVWTPALTSMMQMTASEIHDKWQACDTDEGKTEFLRLLNRISESKFLCSIKLNIWKGEEAYRVDVNVSRALLTACLRSPNCQRRPIMIHPRI